MKRFTVFLFVLPHFLFPQTGTHILAYDVSATINDRTNEITGNAFILFRVPDATAPSFSFLVPKEWTVNSLRDRNNDSYDSEQSNVDSLKGTVFTLERTEVENITDTMFIAVEFSARFDSSSLSKIFINHREFLLPAGESAAWLPLFGSERADRFSLAIALPSNYVPISDDIFDTLSTEGVRIWKRSSLFPTQLSAAFTVCGVADAVRQRSVSADSSRSVSIFSSPVRFNQFYAAAITRQLTEAGQFFARLTGQQRAPVLSYAVVGDASFERDRFSAGDYTIQRNSPAYTVMDSAALKQLAYNYWLIDLARRFCPVTEDSTAVFDDGLAAYLSLRFLASSFPQLEKQERIRSISNALTFFPAGTISAGHTAAVNTIDIVSFKGRYLFFMLEYLLGRESFDSVIVRMSGRYAETPISFEGFQLLCEEEYGSSLAWFFDEWLHRTSAPEYVMQWKEEKTVRGMTVVKATIEQRGVPFTMPVPLVISFGSRSITKRILVEQAKQEFTFVFPSSPSGVELDPNFAILRWLLEIRISAHARTSMQFLSISRDLADAEQEANYVLRLDPNNSTGSAPLAFYVLGSVAGARADAEKAKEYFLKAASSAATAEIERYTLLGLVRYANILEMEGKREDAVAVYQRVIAQGKNNPLLYERAMIRAERYLRELFAPQNDMWFEVH
jgi:tetratricopeptide (TPR) repeat protein